MEILKNLLQVKKIMALLFSIVFSILSLKGMISAEQFIVVFSCVTGYYFGQSSARQAISENNK
ncbi:hypothetical protein [Clostridium tagluense]|uniref:Phage exported protein n=1 Tax=Clostridium tagluense TaxID=360422 RepID=A0A401UM43_9CLOT|nr:hypothetical protein [Clostridium tagluense]GCD10610.1 phage exported protein [Clostridium tagluense]